VSRAGLSVAAFLVSACVVFMADQASKIALVEHIPPGGSVGILGDYLRLSHVRNIGASFGLFPGNTTVLIAVSGAAVAVVLYLAFRARGKTGSMCFLGLILGGALGNLYDRLRFGEVIDFFDVGFGRHRWPVFNVADIAVTVGVFLLLFEYLLRKDERPSRERDYEDGVEAGEDLVGPSASRQ